MAKKNLKVAPTVETLKPYLDRALNDKDFRDDLKEALSAARKLYGPLVKDARDDGAGSRPRASRPTRRCRRTSARRSRSSARPPGR